MKKKNLAKSAGTKKSILSKPQSNNHTHQLSTKFKALSGAALAALFSGQAFAVCTISPGALQDNDTVTCSGSNTTQTYIVQKQNVTLIHEGNWVISGALSNISHTGVLGTTSTTNMDNVSGLNIINNGSIQWDNATHNAANFKYAVGIGSYWTTELNNDIAYTNNGSIKITTAPSSTFSVISGIASVVRRGDASVTNTGTIHVDSSAGSGQARGMLLFGGTDSSLYNSGSITVKSGSSAAGGMHYQSNSGWSPQTVSIVNEGSMDIIGQGSTYGFYFTIDSAAAASLTSAQIVNSGTIHTMDDAGNLSGYGMYINTGGIMANAPFVIHNTATGAINSAIAINFTSASNTDVAFYNEGTVTGHIRTRGGDDLFIQTSGGITGDIISNEGNDTFAMSGGYLAGSLFLEADDDTAVISHTATLDSTVQLDGGAGIDMLTLANQHASAYTSATIDSTQGVNLTGWEQIDLQATQLTLTGDLFESANTGALNIDTTSMLCSSRAGNTIYGNLNNTGTVSLANASTADTLTVTGDYTGYAGHLVLDTALGGDTSATDKLVINGDASGTTHVSIHNIGGQGDGTIEGIEVISVSGISAPHAFVQSGRIVAGAYEYNLQQGNNSGTNPQSWFLTSFLLPVTPGHNDHTLRPEAGAYLSNLSMANAMFNMRLHERLGETQYLDVLTGEKKASSLWVRYNYGHNRFNDTTGQLSTSSDRNVVQIGGDIAQWNASRDGRVNVGIMAGYGKVSGDTSSALSSYDASSKVDGYSLGAYATWYANHAEKRGFYADGWLTWSNLDATVHGQGLHSESYGLDGLTASLEVGYFWKAGQTRAGNEIWVQPQGQLTWMGVHADRHTENNGTVVSSNKNNVQTRLGARVDLRSETLNTSRNIRPFAEINWIHNTKPYAVHMNNTTVRQNGSRNTGEVRVGVEANFNQNTSVWFNLAHQMGSNSYRDTSAVFGLKYSF